MMTKEKLVEDNMGLVGFVLAKYISMTADMGAYSYEDLYQVGCIGLWKAAKSYNPEISKFSTYACRLIRNEIYGELRKLRRTTAEVRLEDLTFSEDYADVQLVDSADSVELQVESAIELDEMAELLSSAYEKASGVTKKGIRIIMQRSQGKTCGEIAAEMDVPVNYITAWTAKARKFLRENLDCAAVLRSGV